MPERLDHAASEDDVALHAWRYRWAARFTSDADVVLDAACGHGFARPFLKGRWIGVDKESLCGNLVADLTTWQPDFEFDVFVGLETIEHLGSVQNYVSVAKRARKYIVLSTPTVPTVGSNPFHLHDFTDADLPALFADWPLIDRATQESTYGIYAFGRPWA